MTDYKFEGWLGHSPESVKGQMKWGEFEPKTWTEEDIDIKVTHCGICGSDLHMLRSGWGPTDYPCCVGHEIVGTVVRVGKNVTQHKLGDRVGVGAQGRSCMLSDCPDCSVNQESYCKRANINTYGSTYPEGGKGFGGYATYHRANQHFAIQIPEGLKSEYAAPLMCGGITVYSPLKNHGCGPGKSVGIVGVGGLGHFAVLFARALGADKVVGISRREAKRAEVLKLGADSYIATEEEEDWATKHAHSLDLIVSTVSNTNMPLEQYLSLIKTNGTFVQVGAPDNGVLPPINAFTLLSAAVKVTGSAIGPPRQIKEMLEFAVEKNIVPWAQTRPLADANQAIVDMDAGKARYRYVLVNENHL
ncbi:chaperonin 10-like protein [Aspergillus pseudoustus]|uniref:Chaperonin 10-like protein n=1 Tax=Aspergillus pseudoustus TaxID=1810923 RepID=A0ABR4INH1_9EURO